MKSTEARAVVGTTATGNFGFEQSEQEPGAWRTNLPAEPVELVPRVAIWADITSFEVDDVARATGALVRAGFTTKEAREDALAAAADITAVSDLRGARLVEIVANVIAIQRRGHASRKQIQALLALSKPAGFSAGQFLTLLASRLGLELDELDSMLDGEGVDARTAIACWEESVAAQVDHGELGARALQLGDASKSPLRLNVRWVGDGEPLVAEEPNFHEFQLKGRRALVSEVGNATEPVNVQWQQDGWAFFLGLNDRNTVPRTERRALVVSAAEQWATWVDRVFEGEAAFVAGELAAQSAAQTVAGQPTRPLKRSSAGGAAK